MDESTQESALLSPSVAEQRQGQPEVDGARTKTAVEKREDEIDKVPSEGLSSGKESKED